MLRAYQTTLKLCFPAQPSKITPLPSAILCLQSPAKAPAKSPRARRASKANADRTGSARSPAWPKVAGGLVSMYSAGMATPATAAALWGADMIVAAVSASLEELLQLEGFVHEQAMALEPSRVGAPANEQAMALEPSRVGVTAQVQHKALLGCSEMQADESRCLAYASLQSCAALTLPAQGCQQKHRILPLGCRTCRWAHSPVLS